MKSTPDHRIRRWSGECVRGDVARLNHAHAAFEIDSARLVGYLATSMLVLAGARVIDPTTSRDEIVDVVVENGRIKHAARDAGRDATESAIVRVDAGGAWIVPSFVDLHVHLREPGHESKETIATGLHAAARGGYGAVCAMPNTAPVNDCALVTNLIAARAREAASVRVHPIGAITVGLAGERLAEMAHIKAAGGIGVSDDGRCVMSAAMMRSALEHARSLDLLVSQHAEDHTLTDGAQMHEGVVSSRLGLRGWPRAAEDIIVARDLILAETTRARYHVAHASTRGTVRLLREAKSRGLAVSAEVTPHHLTLTHEALLGYDTGCKVNPPLREPEDLDALRQALADGTIDCIATDHAPHTSLDKSRELQFALPGMIGLETALPVLLDLVRSGTLTPMRFIDAMSTRPARIAGIDAPTIREGALANFTVIEPDTEWTFDSDIASKSRNSPWLGKKLRGRVRMTVVDGKVVFER